MKYCVSLIAFLFCLVSFSQSGPYTWQDHLALNASNTLARFNGKIYASNYNGIIIIDEEEGSTERLNKINGLSDVNIRLLRVNENTNKLLVIYENSNIDLVDLNRNVKNFPDIKIKTVNGKKSVNEVFFLGKYAYLATGLGIILFDTEKMEIKDTYVIGPGGTNLEVYQVALNDSLIFAATPNGLYYSNHKIKILNNYANWKLVPSIPNGVTNPFCGVVNVQGKIIAASNASRLNQGQPIDTLYSLINNVWDRFTTSPNVFYKLMHVNGRYFSMMAQFGPLTLDVDTKQNIGYITQCNGKDMKARDMVFFGDKNGNMSFWISDDIWGVFQTLGPFSPQNLKPVNGVRTRLVSNIDVYDGEVAVSPSRPDEGGFAPYNVEGIAHRRNNQWEYFESRTFQGATIYDMNCILFDRKDKSHMWGSSWGGGVIEFRDHVIVNQYNSSNSTLHDAFPTNTRAAGLSMDKDGNLWIANSDVKEYIAVRKKDGTFVSYNCEVPRFTRRIFADKNNFVWALHERESGLTVMKHDNFTNFQYKVLTKNAGSGNLQSNSVFSIAEDKDGKIWVGTSEGIRVFYNPSNVFNSSGFDAEPIKIVQDGNVELLLEKETVTAIKVDGANNKWVGTQTGGLYCFNPDGQKELYHFTTENSPLYSNNIVDLNYDEVTGDVYIGSDLGLQSFRSGIIEGAENCKSMYAFPNPVRPSYTGNVFIRGIMDASIVKITDESGNLVWEVKSTGGQVEWNKKNLSGSQVTSGVYVVYAMAATGEIKCLTKVLVIN